VQCRPVDFSFEFDKILREVEKNALLKRSKAAPVKVSEIIEHILKIFFIPTNENPKWCRKLNQKVVARKKSKIEKRIGNRKLRIIR
jgi:hypothetical protein